MSSRLVLREEDIKRALDVLDRSGTERVSQTSTKAGESMTQDGESPRLFASSVSFCEAKIEEHQPEAVETGRCERGREQAHVGCGRRMAGLGPRTCPREPNP